MRRAGLLLHPTSLPGPYGMGDIGPAARQLLAWLEAAGQRIWQMLPVNPVDAQGSPYSSPSAFARNPLLLSIDDLADDGWLRQGEKPYVRGQVFRFDHATVSAARWPALLVAADRARAQLDLGPFRDANPWLADWGLFAALSDAHGPLWTRWPEPLRDRDPAALDAARDRLADDIARHEALQWLFSGQWERMRAEARGRGVDLWGDLPFLVSADSCDTWVHRALFRLGDDGSPEVVAGVPPDLFSVNGQRWGLPLYDNAAHAAEGHRWWCDRAQTLLQLFDAARIDHFRGIAAVWEIPADAPDARTGQWVTGLGRPLLEALRDRLGGLPLLAEDLGVITPDVELLRDDFGLPGMSILQFAFDGSGEGHNAGLPHNHRPNRVCYPGTHDNDTAVGWFDALDPGVSDHVRRYLGTDGRDIAWDLIRAAYRSVARTAVIPMQDVLSLDGESRMNVPGREGGNWGWRMPREALNLVVARKLAEQARLSGRHSLRKPEPAVDSPHAQEVPS